MKHYIKCVAGGFRAILFAVKRKKKHNLLSVSRGYIKNADSVRAFNELLIAEESLVAKRVNNVEMSNKISEIFLSCKL